MGNILTLKKPKTGDHFTEKSLKFTSQIIIGIILKIVVKKMLYKDKKGFEDSQEHQIITIFTKIVHRFNFYICFFVSKANL